MGKFRIAQTVCGYILTFSVSIGEWFVYTCSVDNKLLDSWFVYTYSVDNKLSDSWLNVLSEKCYSLNFSSYS